MHFPHYVKQLEEHNLRDAQRGLAHSYSRAKVKFNVNRVDNMIIQVLRVHLITACTYICGEQDAGLLYAQQEVYECVSLHSLQCIAPADWNYSDCCRLSRYWTR